MSPTKGMKSSEFWMGMLLPVLVVLFQKTLGLDLSPDELYAIVGSGGLYSIGRGIAKVGEAKSGG